MFLKTRLNTLEKKMGLRKKTGKLILSIVRMKKVVSAYRQNPDGSRKDLKSLIGLSLEDLEKSLKQYKEQEDVDYLILESIVTDKKPGQEKQKSPKTRKEKSCPEKRSSLPEMRKPKEIPVMPTVTSEIQIKEKQDPPQKPMNKWQDEREKWIEFYKKNPSVDVSVNHLLNMLDGLTPRGFDKNGRKTGPNDLGRPVNYIN